MNPTEAPTVENGRKSDVLPGEGEIDAYGDWVCITRKSVPEKSEGGIDLPDTVRERMQPDFIGQVVSIGDTVGGKLKKGDRIVYTNVFPMASKKSKEYVLALVHKNHIIGIVPPDSDVTQTRPPQPHGLRSGS